jgi:hypothetical protein
MYSGKDMFRQFKLSGTWLLLSLILCACQPLLRAQDHSAHEGHDEQQGHEGMSSDMPGMDMRSTAPDPLAAMRTPEKLAADKRESEFNHHLTGFFVMVAGIFILAEPWLRARWPKVRYAWPVCFLVAGIFVLVYSDTELWPFGQQSWVYGLSHHMEVRQHKSFALILLGVGVIEFLRARGTLKAACGDRRLDNFAFSRTSRWDARRGAHGADGTHSDRASHLHGGGIWDWSHQRVV